MNRLELTFYPYTIRLKTPINISGTNIKERMGFIIELKSENGETGIGDAAPFPELGTESFEETEEALGLIELNTKIDINDVRKSLRSNLKNFEAFPALRHGLEQAILNLICSEKQTTLDELLNLRLKKTVIANAAINFTITNETIQKAKKLIEQGFTTIKFKTEGRDFEEVQSVIKAIRDSNDKEIRFRIDINGKWDLETAVNNLKQFEYLNIEFVEQPVNSIDDFIRVKNHTSVKIAADKSIRNLVSAKAFINNRAVDVIIIKPMLVGGLIPAIDLIEMSEKNNIIPVVNSSFESAVGRTNAVIAAASVKADIAHGITDSLYYEQDISSDKFPIISGKIRL